MRNQQKMKSQIIELAQELIRRESISPQDAGCQQVIANRLAAQGFQIEWMPFGETLNFTKRHPFNLKSLCC